MADFLRSPKDNNGPPEPGRLDAYLNLFKIRHAIPLPSGKPDLRL
jgi:hypothetical protein